MAGPLRSGAVHRDGDDPPLPLPIQQELHRVLPTIRFGSIELVIHNGRIVQLERREKVRFDQQLRPPES